MPRGRPASGGASEPEGACHAHFPNVLLSSQHRAACRILHAVAVDFEPAVRPFEQHPAETGAVPAQLADRPAFYETCAADHLSLIHI